MSPAASASPASKGFFSSWISMRWLRRLHVPRKGASVGRAARSGTTGMPCLTGSKSERLDCSAGELGFLNQLVIAPEASIIDRSDRPAPGQALLGERETFAPMRGRLRFLPFAPNPTKAEQNDRYL